MRKNGRYRTLFRNWCRVYGHDRGCKWSVQRLVTGIWAERGPRDRDESSRVSVCPIVRCLGCPWLSPASCRSLCPPALTRYCVTISPLTLWRMRQRTTVKPRLSAACRNRETWSIALYIVGTSDSWLAWNNGTTERYAAMHCPP